jgi:hypothetical protein
VNDRPTPAELAEAVREFLEREILPILEDDRLRFRTVVAINGLGIAQRELESDQEIPDAQALLDRLHEGEPPSLAELKAHVAAKLRISNPSYLERYA